MGHQIEYYSSKVTTEKNLNNKPGVHSPSSTK